MSVEDFIKALAVYVVGIVTAIAVFRSKFVSIDARFEQDKKLNDADRAAEKALRAMEREHDKEMLEVSLTAMRRSIARTAKVTRQIETRQRISMELTADIARKLGVQHRALGDAIPRSLAEEDTHNGNDGD